MTDEAANSTIVANGKTTPVKRCVAIVLDNRVFSAPRVQNKISGGNTQITGIGEVVEATDLANILKSGQLEAKTRIIEEQVIGPSLGQRLSKPVSYHSLQHSYWYVSLWWLTTLHQVS